MLKLSKKHYLQKEVLCSVFCVPFTYMTFLLSFSFFRFCSCLKSEQCPFGLFP